MPEVIIFHDDTSENSHISFSTACEEANVPPLRQLRRRSTVTTLKRWASKRVSRASMNDSHGNELSEKNLTSLDLETRFLTSNQNNAREKQPNLNEVEGKDFANKAGPIQEVVETIPDHDLQFGEGRNPYLLREYDAFCHEFTLSGSPRTKRTFDLSMTREGSGQATSNLATGKSRTNGLRSSHLAEESGSPSSYFDYQADIEQNPSIKSAVENPVLAQQAIPSTYPGSPSTYYASEASSGKNADFQTPSTYQPQPPSQVMTPLVYMEMQRATRERKLSRQKSLWQPLRSLFSSESLYKQSG